MSEINDGQEPDYSEDFSNIIESQVGWSVPVFAKFDEFRGELYAKLAELSVKLPDFTDGSDPEALDIEGVGEQYGEILTELLEEPVESDHIINTAVTVMKTDSDERITMMRSILSENPELIYFKRDLLESLVTNIVRKADSYEEAIRDIVTLYLNDLKSDIAVFVQLLVDEREQTHAAHSHDEAPSHKQATFEIKKAPKEHILDVAKIAAGVALALTVDRLLHRRRS